MNLLRRAVQSECLFVVYVFITSAGICRLEFFSTKIYLFLF